MPLIFECVVNLSEGRDDAGARRAGRGRRAVPARPAPRPGPQPFRAHPRRPRRHRASPAPGLSPRRPWTTRPQDAPGAHPRLGCSTSCPSSPTSRGPAPEDLTGRGGAPRRLRPLARRPIWVCRASSTGPLPGGRTRTLPDVRRHAFAAVSEGPCPRPGPGAGGPAGRRHRGRRPAGPRGLQRVGLLGRGGPPVAPLVRGPHVRALGLRSGVGPRSRATCSTPRPSAGPPLRRRGGAGRRGRRRGRGGRARGSRPRDGAHRRATARWSGSALVGGVNVESRLSG